MSLLTFSHNLLYIPRTCSGRKAYCYQKGSKLSKNCIHQNTRLKMAGGGGASPLDLLMPVLITMSLITTLTNQFSFSMMSGEILSKLF